MNPHDNTLDLFQIIDIIPAALFIINADAVIVGANAQARKMANLKKGDRLDRLCGEVLHCFHAAHSELGCGTTPACSDCVIWDTVKKSTRGQIVMKKKAEFNLNTGRGAARLTYLVSATPFKQEGRSLTILSMEDITELVQLRELVPICSNCKKIRNDQDYWESIEAYLHKHFNANMTHGICPDCAEKLYPGLTRRNTSSREKRQSV